MRDFSDYIVYVDESGDHSLEKIHVNYPIFSLAFCLFNKKSYTENVVPLVQKFKFNYWGHDSVVLHEHDIRKSMSNDYSILSDEINRKDFLRDLNKIIVDSPFFVIASVIRKVELKAMVLQASNPYELSMLFCMERLARWLSANGEANKLIHVIVESRGKAEDKELEKEFYRICENKHAYGKHSKLDFSKMNFSLRFVKKQANSTGLQLADLIARPLGLHVLRPTQKNQAFEIIKRKLVTSAEGGIDGLKVYPQITKSSDVKSKLSVDWELPVLG